MHSWIRIDRALFITGLMALGVPACALDDKMPDEVDDGLAPIDLDAENAHDLAGQPIPDTLAAPAPRSSGFYAFPYEAGTRVRVNRDHLNHTPENRIDMSGTSGGPYRVVAAASGHVRFVEDSHNATGDCADNNYVWIEHTNGEWTKYTHIAQDSASDDAGLSVGEWVTAGQFIGIESDIGCATGDHVHFEVAVPDDPADPINPVGGYIKGENRVPKVCGISGQTFVAGTTYTVPEVRPGFAEYARHQLSDSAYQAVFTAASNCGYRLDWNDGFDWNGSPYYNVVFHPNTGPAVDWKSHRRVTDAQLDGLIDTYVGDQDYSLVHLDAYNVGTAVRYAAIFKRGASIPTTATYHGASAAAHQNTLDYWTSLGWRPRVVSATSVGGTRTYAGVYTYGSIGGYAVRSFQTPAQYQANYTAQKDAGRQLLYLNSYVHNNAPYYTAIWASSAPDSVYARHGMSAGSYQSYWSWLTGAGWETTAVTGLEIGGVPQYAAFWNN